MKRWVYVIAIALALLFLTAGLCSDKKKDKKPPAVDPNASLNPNATNGTASGNSTGNNTGGAGANSTSCISELTITATKTAVGDEFDYLYSYQATACENGSLVVNMLDAADTATEMESQDLLGDVVLEQNGSVRTATEYAQVCAQATAENETRQECAVV